MRLASEATPSRTEVQQKSSALPAVCMSFAMRHLTCVTFSCNADIDKAATALWQVHVMIFKSSLIIACLKACMPCPSLQERKCRTGLSLQTRACRTSGSRQCSYGAEQLLCRCRKTLIRASSCLSAQSHVLFSPENSSMHLLRDGWS